MTARDRTDGPPGSDPELLATSGERARRYRAAGAWRDEAVGELVLRGGREHPGSCALVDGDRRFTHAELAATITAVAHRLRGLGIRAGDRVAVQLPNRAEFVLLTLGLLLLGAPPVLIVPTMGERELEETVAVAAPVAFAVGARRGAARQVELARRLRDRHPGLRTLLVTDGDDTTPGEVDLTGLCRPPEDPPEPRPGLPDRVDPAGAAVFLLSSGTTGLPKMIPRLHEEYGCMTRRTTVVSGVSARSRLLVVMPAAHGYVYNCPGILGTLAAGGRVVLGSAGDPHAAFELVERERVTHCALVPAVVTEWLRAAPASERDLSSLEVIQVGGAPLPPSVAARIGPELGVTLQQVYGMSEGPVFTTGLDDPEEIVLNTQGRPDNDLDEVLVVDPAGRPLPAGEVGELLIRGPHTIAGYYRDPEATRTTFRADGFYRTGDLATLRPTGELVVTGRIRDAINRGGQKISAEELDALTAAHPAVRSSATIGAPDDVLGEIVCVYLVPHKEASVSLGQMRMYLAEQGVARHKLPERLELTDSLPMTGTGKIDKKALRDDLRGRMAAR